MLLFFGQIRPGANPGRGKNRSLFHSRDIAIHNLYAVLLTCIFYGNDSNTKKDVLVLQIYTCTHSSNLLIII